MIYLERETWIALNRLDRDKADVIIPLGPLEQHGPHLPIGTDAFQSLDLARKVAERCEVHGRTALLHPLLPIGSEPLPGPGSVNIPVATVEAVVKAVLESFAIEGFETMAIITLHGRRGHHKAIFSACDVISSEMNCIACNPVGHVMGDFLSGTIFEDPRLTRFKAELPSGDSHAGYVETSWALATRPELVSSVYKKLPSSPNWEQIRSNPELSTSWPGYLGDPRGARAEVGVALCEVLADRVWEIYETILSGVELASTERYW